MNYLPQFFPSYWTNDSEVFGIPFTDEISIGFVIREIGGYSYLLKDDFNLLSIDTNTLLTSAINNLDKEFENCDIKEYKLNGGSVVFWNSENDNFTAVRILSTKYSSILKKIFPVDFYFSIPDRDLITCWYSTDDEENEKFTTETIEDFNDSEYRLSDKKYLYSKVRLTE